MTADDILRPRVARGAALLDQHRPGWFREVRTASLEMASCSDCVLGQVYGLYGRGADALGLFDFYTQAEHGFDMPHHVLLTANITTSPRDYLLWCQLEQCWVDEIHAREQQAQPVAEPEPELVGV